MKKIIFSLVLCLCAGFAAMAQDEDDPAFVNKRGVALLPQAGDFALGVDASPFLRYMGNLFTSDFNRSPRFNGVGQTFYGKYFVQDNRAIRMRLSLNLGNDASKGIVPNDYELANNPLNPFATVIDVQNSTYTDVTLGIGYEFRRGKGRAQGFWGYEVSLGYLDRKDKIDYANPMTEINQAPSTYDFINDFYGNPLKRMTEKNWGETLSGGLGAFVGVEYFFAPRISIGGEFWLGFQYRSEEQTETTWEYWDTSLNKVQTITERWWKNGWTAQTSGAITSASYGSIFLMFHF